MQKKVIEINFSLNDEIKTKNAESLKTITIVEKDIQEINKSIDGFEKIKIDLVKKMRGATGLQSAVVGRKDQLKKLLGNYEKMAKELGVTPNSNAEYSNSLKTLNLLDEIESKVSDIIKKGNNSIS